MGTKDKRTKNGANRSLLKPATHSTSTGGREGNLNAYSPYTMTRGGQPMSIVLPFPDSDKTGSTLRARKDGKARLA